MHHILQNPYYMGLVAYRGIHYQGKHPALVEPEVWLAVQVTLASHYHTGEKNRKHPHYLRGSIYCSVCRGRLVYSQNTGNGGTYEYYFCVKKKTKTNNCRRPAMRLEKIEDSIADFDSHFEVGDEKVEQIRGAVMNELASQQAEAKRSMKRAGKHKQQVLDERQKLLQAHYSGAIPQDLLASEMQRLTRALAEAEGEIKAANTTSSEVEATLAAALAAASKCEQAYLSAPEPVRRQINQGFFEKLLIGEDGSVEWAELTEPFRALLDHGQTVTCATAAETDVRPAQLNQDATNEAHTDMNRPRPSPTVQRVLGDVR